MQFLTFDIETVPLPWESFSESQQEYLIRGAKTEEEIQKKKDEMGLSPMTAQVVCIGLMLCKKNEDGSFNEEKIESFAVDNSITEKTINEVVLSTQEKCYLCSEAHLLEIFWKILKKYDPIHLISFNGRNFDAPFLMLRSSLLRIKPSKNLMAGTKFSYAQHTDLIDELTFYSGSAYGATRRFNFDFFARAYGIHSPKSEGIDGSKVPEFFHNGKILEIAEYCLRDVKATWELFKVWNEYLRF